MLTSCAKGAPGTGTAEAKEAVVRALAYPPEVIAGTARFSSRLSLRTLTEEIYTYRTVEGVADFKRGLWSGEYDEKELEGSKHVEFFANDKYLYRKTSEVPGWERRTMAYQSSQFPIPNRPLIQQARRWLSGSLNHGSTGSQQSYCGSCNQS